MRWTFCANLVWLGWWALQVRPQPVLFSPIPPPVNSSQPEAFIQGTFPSNLATTTTTNGSVFQSGFKRFPIPNTGRALQFRRIGDELPNSIVQGLFHEAGRDLRQQLRDHTRWERVPGAQWDIIHQNIIFFVKENSELPPRYPKLTWEVVDCVVRGLQEFFRVEEGGRFRRVEFDVLTQFNAHGYVDIAFGGLVYLEPPLPSYRRSSL